MSIHDMTLRDALQHLDDELRELLTHPETTQQDKASITLAALKIADIRRRHLGRWTPVNPATLPPRRPGQAYPKLPKGWAVDWENGQEVGHG